MKKSKVYSAMTQSGAIQIKAYNKRNALKGFKIFDSEVKMKDISTLRSKNSHQEPIETACPELFI